MLGEDVPVPSRPVALQVRSMLREVNRATGDCLIAIEDAASTEEVVTLLIRFLARCGSPLLRRNVLGAANARIRAFGGD